MKTHIPKSLGSKSNQVPLRMRSWQWCFTHADHSDLFSLCGTQVAKIGRKTNQRVKFQRRCRNKQIHLKKEPSITIFLENWAAVEVRTLKKTDHQQDSIICRNNDTNLYGKTYSLDEGKYYKMSTPPRSISAPAGCL